MKRSLLSAVFCLVLASATHAQGVVSLSMGQPGFYGRIDIGGYQQPPLLFPNAVMGNPGVYTGEPIYMHVPPEQAYHWSRYCGLYGACDWMVYFVQNDWYGNVYVPGYRGRAYGYVPPPPVYVPRPVYVPVPGYFPPPRPLPPPHYHPPRPPGPPHHGHPPRPPGPPPHSNGGPPHGNHGPGPGGHHDHH